MAADRLQGSDYQPKELVLNDARVEWLNKLAEAGNSTSPVQQAIGLVSLLVELYSIADPRVAVAAAIVKPLATQLYERATGRSNAPLDSVQVRDAYSAVRNLFDGVNS
jgi:hypothetical protein